MEIREILYVCIGVAVVLAFVVGILTSHRKLRRENWGACYCCHNDAPIAGWRVLFDGKQRVYIAAPACMSCRMVRQLAGEGVSMTAFADRVVCGHCQNLLRFVAAKIAEGVTPADWPILKVAFFPWRSAAEDLAEQMNDDDRSDGGHKAASAPEA